MKLDKSCVDSAVYGGIFYGGGGGGYFETGRKLALDALDIGTVELLGADEIESSAKVACVGFVGAPTKTDYLACAEDVIRSVNLFIEGTGIRPDAFIANENGAMATVNGWIQAAYLGVPVLDAPANGRAHPTGVMGSMGLDRDDSYLSEQAIVDGHDASGHYTEAFFRGSTLIASSGVRSFSSVCGGLLPVVRNLTTAEFIRKNAAVGATSLAMRVGAVNCSMLGAVPLTAAEAVAKAAGGSVIDVGTITRKTLRTEGGFDYGTIGIDCSGTVYTSVVWNELLSLSSGDRSFAEFPDLTVLFDLDEIRSITSAEAVPGRRVALIVVPKAQLILGRGMFVKENFTRVNEILAMEQERRA